MRAFFCLISQAFFHGLPAPSGTVNVWCYALGLLVALTTPTTGLVAALLLAQGGLVALGLILIDEVDNAYGDLTRVRWPATA